MFFRIEQTTQHGSHCRWVYKQGTPENPGRSIALSTSTFDNEKECRSNIAQTKKAFAAARTAKVVS